MMYILKMALQLFDVRIENRNEWKNKKWSKEYSGSCGQ